MVVNVYGLESIKINVYQIGGIVGSNATYINFKLIKISLIILYHIKCTNIPTNYRKWSDFIMRNYAEQKAELLNLRAAVNSCYERIKVDKHVNPAHYQYAYEEYRKALNNTITTAYSLFEETTANHWEDKQEDAQWYVWLKTEQANAEGLRYNFLYELTGDMSVDF